MLGRYGDGMIVVRKWYGEDVVGMEIVLNRYGSYQYLVRTLSVPSTCDCGYLVHTFSVPGRYQHIETPVPYDF